MAIKRKLFYLNFRDLYHVTYECADYAALLSHAQQQKSSEIMLSFLNMNL